jgi:carbamoyltransferase
MHHLGIAYGHNATVAVVRAGELVFCQSEERRNRIKNSLGFPDLTLAHVYEHVCPPGEVASCTLFLERNLGYLGLREAGFRSGTMRSLLSAEQVRAWQADPAGADAAGAALLAAADRLKADPAINIEAATWFVQRLGLPPDRIVHLDHHLGHANSALPFLDSGGDTLVFTLDGEGDGTCAMVARLSGGRFTVLSTAPDYMSLGKVYHDITGVLGFKSNEHEYKVMGLAPYAKPEYYRDLVERFLAILRVNAAGEWEGSFRSHRGMLLKLVELCTFQRFDAIAGALQAYTERVICDWIRHWVEKTGIRSIACAGGVFMNVKANQKVLELDCVERMAVVPSCGDESTAIGCAVHGSRLFEPIVPIRPVRHLYLGESFGAHAVERQLAESGVAGEFEVSEPADINAEVARLLAAGEVVARCTGPMEFGARALGNRSILSHPGRAENIPLINDAIKNRDFWMPFAPSVLAETAGDFVAGAAKMFSPFMMVSFDATPRGRRDLVAALHRADFTLRPQMLAREANPDYHAIISGFRERTGIGAVLNTSFNLHGEPIVGTPADAIRTMQRSGLRYLALDKFLLAKPGVPAAA